MLGIAPRLIGAYSLMFLMAAAFGIYLFYATRERRSMWLAGIRHRRARRKRDL